MRFPSASASTRLATVSTMFIRVHTVNPWSLRAKRGNPGVRPLYSSSWYDARLVFTAVHKDGRLRFFMSMCFRLVRPECPVRLWRGRLLKRTPVEVDERLDVPGDAVLGEVDALCRFMGSGEKAAHRIAWRSK